jgi:double zinc ribbon protein
MRCSKCGFENPDGMRFCGQCTMPLALVCPNCQFENPPGFKFCGQCTSTLGPVTAKPEPLRTSLKLRESDDSAVLDGERKTVTALFADITGSTELMEELDPEEARAIIDPALKIMVEAVRRYEGYVVQSTGDWIFRPVRGAGRTDEEHGLALEQFAKSTNFSLPAGGGASSLAVRDGSGLAPTTPSSA